MSDSASTVVPSDHFQPFIVIVIFVLWLANTGALARDSGYWTAVDAPRPNQYRGRYIRNWNWLMLETEKYPQPM